MKPQSILPPGPLLQTPDVEAAEQWLCENLFFTPLETNVLKNGTCVLTLVQGPAEAVPAPEDGSYFTGFEHIALRTRNIDEAIAWCKLRGLDLMLKGGGSFYNPGVFGQGERYYNIFAPFGAVLEISQRVNDSGPAGPSPIFGLDHLGVPCADIRMELDFLKGLGFLPEFPIVHNFNEAEGNILCDMVSCRELTLEIYQFSDKKPCSMPTSAPLRGIRGLNMISRSPGGLQMLE